MLRFLFVRLGTGLLLGSLLAFAFGQSNSVEKSAKAILEANCLTCHGDLRTSDLDLRELATILKGGKRGPAVVPGNAEASILYKAVTRQGELKMPPGKTPLAESEIRGVARLDRRGCALGIYPATAAASWWSFRKPVPPPVPAVKNPALVRNPIDAFILAKLEQNGLRPAPQADRRTLVRRAYFDLHGLPPSPEQVEQFVNDQSSDAYEKLIDRLLASQRYGERWGRYWLDLVRYADTSGFETDHFFTTAWRYRDWVIKSFNDDKRYDTFVQEQIAADELWSTNMDLEGTLKLPKEKEENVNRRIGTSLFTLGSFPIEFTYYGDQFRAEWQADAVDTVGGAFLGLTVGVRALPRSQVRPDQPARLLPHDGAVRRQRRARDSTGESLRYSNQHPKLSVADPGADTQADGGARPARQQPGRRRPAATASAGPGSRSDGRRRRRILRAGDTPRPATRRTPAKARGGLFAGTRAVSYGQRSGARRNRA